jgi:sucrose phosphorylase
VQFLTPGVPQVYYVGLLAGSNDMQLLSHSNVGRDVNRHYYTRGEIEQELRRPVVRALLRLIRFRNSHPAFEGTCVVTGGGPRLTITWTHQDERVVLDAALDTAFATLTWTGERGPRTAALSRLP